MKKIILFFIEKNRGWGFQQSNTTYSDDVDLLVLPCSWFDAGWITTDEQLKMNNFFKHTDKIYNFDNFFNGSFCYHWHNKWNDNIEKMSTAKQLYNLLKKIRIAIMIPICSRGQNFKDFNQIPLLTTFLPNFEKTKSEKFEYNFYIGYDDDDDFYIKNQENLEKLNMKIFELNNCQHAPAFAWNKLFEIAYKDGNDFFFQIGDDVELKSQNWTEVFIEKLNSNNGIGVVGPCDLTNYFQRVNHDKPYVIENSFVSRKHYEIFGYFFYPTIKNWFCDTWITEIYRPFLTYIFTDKIVQNKIRDNRYKIEYVSELNKLIEISREKIKLFTDI
jgi:hypothetical protein